MTEEPLVDTPVTKLPNQEVKQVAEITPETITATVNDMQTILGASVPADILIFKADAIGSWGAVQSYPDPEGRIWAEVITSRNFIEGSPYITEFQLKSAHEVAHVITAHEVNNLGDKNWVVAEVLSEGISEMAALAHVLDSGAYPTVDIIAKTMEDQLKETDLKLARSAMENPPKSRPHTDTFMDGYTMQKRSIWQALGFRLVMRVLPSDKIFAWPVLIQNPPTSHEVLNPDLYKERVAGFIAAYTSKPIEEKTLELRLGRGKVERLI